MRKLVKVNGIWRLQFRGKPERRYCFVCNRVTYSWKEEADHKATHTWSECDKALRKIIVADIRWKLMRDCPT